MKLLFHTLAILIVFLSITPSIASETKEEFAKKTATRFCKNPILKKTGVKKSNSLRSSDLNDVNYYIFSNDLNKFCIISGDGEKVLGYGDNYSDELPPQLQAILDAYESTLLKQNTLRSQKVRENIPSFMDVVFGHRSPYNKYVPIRDGKPGPTGCVATALAQILKYYEYPSKLINDIPGYSHYSKYFSDSIYTIEGQKAEGRNYNWKNVLNHYNGDTTEVLNEEIAKIMIDCGKSIEAKFEQNATSAKSDMLLYSLVHYFGYNSDSIKEISRNYYYREEWLDIIHDELLKKRPVYMSATSYDNGGHAFICDGYMDGFLHINWGWNGDTNGYFDVDILDYHLSAENEQYFPQLGYSFFQSIIIGIVPGAGEKIIPIPEPSSSVIRTPSGIQDTTAIEPTIIDLNNIKMIGYYSDSSILLHANLEIEKLRDSTKDLALAIIVDGDTVMSEINMDYVTSGNTSISMQRKFMFADINKEMKMILMQTDNYEISEEALNPNDWKKCEEIQPIEFKLSDIKTFSIELAIDTIVHSFDTTTHKFDIVFSNPTQYEYYDEVYFVIDQYVTGLMISIPAGGTVKRHLEHQIPVATKYIQGGFGIMSNYLAKQIVFGKDTFSHVFCNINVENETQILLQVYNATKDKYSDTYHLCLANDTIISQQILVNSNEIIKLNFNLPVIKSDSDMIKLDYMKYSLYNKENNQIGEIIPLDYYGTISQEIINDEMMINIDLKEYASNNIKKMTLGVTSTLDNISKYERVTFKNTDNSDVLKGTIKYSDYFKQRKPQYIGLCKNDGTFYAYMELKWQDSNSSFDIPSTKDITIIPAKGGVWILSDDKDTLTIYSANGSVVKVVNINEGVMTFVTLKSGIYAIKGNKFRVKTNIVITLN